jgi:hypothetical protein
VNSPLDEGISASTKEKTVATGMDSSWFPLFELQDWTYQSVLTLPTPTENSAAAGAAITARKWAKGAVALGQAFNSADGYTLTGTLSFAPGIELEVSAKGALGSEDTPATFEATGIGTAGRTKGAIYQLVGWVFAEQPITQGGGRVLSVRGSVRAVRGPDTKPETELGGMPLGTVGSFEIARAS